MRRSPSVRRREKANPGGEAHFTRSGSGLHLISVVADVAAGQWPNKTAMNLALRAEISERQAKEILARRATGISGDTLGNLLLSDAGFAFLAALMSDRPSGEQPDWWMRVKRQMSLSDLRRAHEEQKKLIERLEAEAGGGAG